MIDERELLERALEKFTLEPGILDRVALRREHKQRRQRLTAGALGLAIGAALVVAGVTTLWDPAPALNDPVTPPPSTAPKLPEPLVDLERGYHFVDVRSGEATPLPASIRTVEGAGNFEVSPDGSMILFDNASITAASDEPVELGLHQLYVANIDGSDVQQFTDDPVGASQGSWSPDGTKVVYLGGWAKLCCYSNPANLTVLDVETGTIERLAHGPAEHFQYPFFSADGNSILFTRIDWGPEERARDDLWTTPIGGGAPELLLDDRGWGELSPDGSSIVYQWIETKWWGGCASDYGVAWVSDADGSDPRPLAPSAANDGRGAGAGEWSPDGSRIAYYENLVPYEPCAWDSTPGVYVLDAETGDRTLVAFGWPIDWMDDRTLLIRVPRRGEQ